MKTGICDSLGLSLECIYHMALIESLNLITKPTKAWLSHSFDAMFVSFAFLRHIASNKPFMSEAVISTYLQLLLKTGELQFHIRFLGEFGFAFLL